MGDNLKQVLGLKEAIMIGVGGMIGSSIFGISGMTYYQAGSAAMLSWFIASLIILLYSLNIAELATKFPEAGGLYVYPLKTLGKSKTTKTFFGWISAWSWLNVTILGTAFSAIFVANYLGSLIPSLKSYVVPLAIIWIALCWYVNVRGISLMGKMSIFLTSFLIIICMLYFFKGFGSVDYSNFANFFAGGSRGARGIIGAIPQAMLGYGSVIAIASVAEEIKNPGKNVPKAISYALFITVIVYLLILFSTYGAFGWQEINPQSGGYYAPLQFAVANFSGSTAWLSPLISIAALLALTTTMLVLVMDAGRTLLAMGRREFLPEQFAHISEKYNTPTVSLTVASMAAAVIACFPQFIQQIVSTGSFTQGIMVLIIVFSLLSSRSNKQKLEAKFKVPGGKIIPIITIIVVIGILSQLTKESFVLAGWWYLLGLVWFVFRYFTKKEIFITDNTTENL